MNYEDTKNALMEAYPSLFVDEADVLEQLFFINGNGYTWVEGELVDNYYSSAKEMIEASKKQERDFYEGQKKFCESKKYVENKIKRLDDPDYARKERKVTLAERMAYCSDSKNSNYYIYKNNMVGSRLYPLCEYAKIMNIPKDIKPDWLAAARKAIKLTKTLRFKLTKKDVDFISKAEKLIEEM